MTISQIRDSRKSARSDTRSPLAKIHDWLPPSQEVVDYVTTSSPVPSATSKVRHFLLDLVDEPSLGLYSQQLRDSKARRDAEVDSKFETLREWWTRDTALTATGSAHFMHPAYQQIIGLGPSVLGKLLTCLRDEPDHWFWALAAISGEDPAAGSQTFQEARDAWLEWAVRAGHLT